MTINTSSAISKVEISETLARMRALSSQVKTSEAGALSATKPSQFHEVFNLAKDSVAQVNESQVHSESLKTSYLQGDPNVSISQVMVSNMESKIAFEGLLVVRNKLLEAYKEIMNMPI
jgi:flagellar hook-basal body complex protein FliE